MKAFGTLLLIIGLGIALVGVLNNRETDYDKIIRQNRQTSSQGAGELRTLRNASDAIHDMAGAKADNRITDSTIESLQQSTADNAAELEERVKARSSQFTTTLVVAGVFVVLGIVLRAR